jgi:DNA-binding NarL/FixJ family response regulator
VPQQKFPRVLIGDDHALVAQAIEHLLTPEFDVIGIAQDGRQLVEKTEVLRPDIVLIDVEMPRLNGLDAGQRILASFPNTKIIYLTMSSDPEVEQEAIARGAFAFLQKTVGRAQLYSALHRALEVPNDSASQGEAEPNPYAQHGDSTLQLTDRQRDVLQLLAEGLSMKQVGAELNLATRTVAFHKYRIMETLALTNDAELVQFAVRKHMVFLDERRRTPDAAHHSQETTPEVPRRAKAA